MSEEVENAIIGLLRQKKYYNKYYSIIRPEYFVNEYTAILYDYLGLFFSKYPDKEMASKRNLKLSVDLKGDDRKAMIELISSLSFKEEDADVVGDKIKEFIKNGIAGAVLRKNLKAMGGEGEYDIDDMVNQLQVAKDFDLSPDEIYDYGEETNSLHRTFKLSGTMIYTGVEGLDYSLGFPPTTGELWIIMGPPGRGKTQFLLNMVVNAAAQGKRAIYITAGDQGRLRVQGRIDSLISDISFTSFSDPSQRTLGLLRKRVRERIISPGGKIYIQDWSDTSCTPNQIEGLIQVIEEGVDLVAVDYPGLMRPNKRYLERRHEIGSINNDLRRIAVRNDILVWAGSQSNRSALDSKVITMKHLAEDIQQAWVADGIGAYCQTPEEEEEDMGRIYLAKARRPKIKQYEVPILIDPDTGRIE